MKSLTLALGTVATVSAHGHVTGIVAGGKYYMGYTPNFQYMNPVPKVPAWSAGGYGMGGIVAGQYGRLDIVCHDNPKPGQAYAEVKAGDSINVQWSNWPDSHHGPIIDYLAPCPGDCTTLSSPTLLKFTKTAEAGLVKPGAPNTYIWATDAMHKNNNTWISKIPSSLKPGNYVLRNEIIALHTAGTVGGAQNYPQCFNLKVTGNGGKALPGGVPATQFYRGESQGIVFNIAAKVDSYPVPGPPLWTG
ncbi:glycoside hydrolase [Tothia fuscella]|uniref:Glycoside hydrolase n=1 Tax=Tothia fuscella TaxID=1048955 RepID=A0A9P4NQK1_9PEZI|nr:glycoside hydrolase [Tothia fuscella]